MSAKGEGKVEKRADGGESCVYPSADEDDVCEMGEGVGSGEDHGGHASYDQPYHCRSDEEIKPVGAGVRQQLETFLELEHCPHSAGAEQSSPQQSEFHQGSPEMSSR
jgi:hypothetical protein